MNPNPHHGKRKPRENPEGRGKMPKTEQEIAAILIKLKEMAPNVYRHIMGMIAAVQKIVK